MAGSTRHSERAEVLSYIRERDKEASRALRKASVRTLKAIRSAHRQIEKQNPGQARGFIRATRSYASPPPRGKYALTAVGRGRKLSKDGTSPGPGVKTVHFQLNQTASGEAASRHQHYIEREGACASSFGNIDPHRSERARFWREIHEKTIRRKGSIRLLPEADIELKRRILTSVDEICDQMDLSDKEKERLQILAKADDAKLQQADITLRTSGSAQHKKWLRWVCLTHQDILESNPQNARSPEEMLDDEENPAGKKYTAWTPPGVRERKPRDGIVQRRVILELPHETSLSSMEHAVATWCRKNLKDVSWHATIHRPENENDPRNWHAHIVYSQFLAKKASSGKGWEFENPGEPLPENARTVKILTGNQEKDPVTGQKPDRKQTREDTKNLIKGMRNSLCRIYNAELRIAGAETRYDPRSYKDMGIDSKPGAHAGPQASGARERGSDHSWHGYGGTWEHEGEDPSQEKQDAEDRARLIASFIEAEQNLAHSLLNRFWKKPDLNPEDSEWDRLFDQVEKDLKAKESPIPKPATATIPPWHLEWQRLMAARTPDEDPLHHGRAAHHLVVSTPELGNLKRVLDKSQSRIPENLDSILNSVPENLRIEARNLCIQAGWWRKASLAWKRPAEKLVQEIRRNPGASSDLQAREFLDKAEEAGIPEDSLDLLLDDPGLARTLQVCGTRGRRRVLAEKEILPAFDAAKEFRHRRDVITLLQPLLEKHEEHLVRDHPRRGAVFNLRIAVLENQARFREMWDSGKILEMPEKPWFRETRLVLSEVERQAFDRNLTELQETRSRNQAEEDQARQHWEGFRKLNLRSTDSEDTRLSRLVAAEDFDPGNLSRINPRAGRVVELAFAFRDEGITNLRKITQDILDPGESQASRLEAALDVSGSWPKSAAALGSPELSVTLGKLTRDWAETLAREITLPAGTPLARNAEEPRIDQNLFPEKKPQAPDPEIQERNRSWEISRRYSRHEKAAANLCPFEHPMLKEWLAKARTEDTTLVEKTETLENSKDPQWRRNLSQAELERLLELRPGKARRIARILGSEKIPDLQEMAGQA